MTLSVRLRPRGSSVKTGILFGDMNVAWLARIRWRRRGAWMWPAFALLTIVDAVIGHALPPGGDTQTVVAAALLGCALNLIGVVVLSWPVGELLRRMRPGLPRIVARDYAGTTVVSLVAVGLLAAGLAHRSTIQTHREALRNATVLAAAWIGDRAPAEFRRNAADVNTFTIEPGSVYRSCVPSSDGRRSYCVIVRPLLPLPQSVRYAGGEPNSVFAQGAG
jgi:hypothetical protein